MSKGEAGNTQVNKYVFSHILNNSEEADEGRELRRFDKTKDKAANVTSNSSLLLLARCSNVHRSPRTRCVKMYIRRQFVTHLLKNHESREIQITNLPNYEKY
jgi:hypothetical protein